MDNLLALASRKGDIVQRLRARDGNEALVMLRTARPNVPSPRYLGVVDEIHWCTHPTYNYSSPWIWHGNLHRTIEDVVPKWMGKYDGVLIHVETRDNRAVAFVGAVTIRAALVDELSLDARLEDDSFVVSHPEHGMFLALEAARVTLENERKDPVPIGARLAKKGVFGYVRDGANVHYVVPMRRY